MLDISQRLIEFAKCLFDLPVERTNVPLLSCKHSHCLFVVVVVVVFVTLRHGIADPVTGWSPKVPVYI